MLKVISDDIHHVHVGRSIGSQSYCEFTVILSMILGRVAKKCLELTNERDQENLSFWHVLFKVFLMTIMMMMMSGVFGIRAPYRKTCIAKAYKNGRDAEISLYIRMMGREIRNAVTDCSQDRW